MELELIQGFSVNVEQHIGSRTIFQKHYISLHNFANEMVFDSDVYGEVACTMIICHSLIVLIFDIEYDRGYDASQIDVNDKANKPKIIP